MEDLFCYTLLVSEGRVFIIGKGGGRTWVVTVKGPKWMGPALRIWVMVVGMDIVGGVVVGVGVDMYV